MAIARSRGKLRGKQPKLSAKQQREVRCLHGAGEHTLGSLADLFSVSRPTIYRALERSLREG